MGTADPTATELRVNAPPRAVRVLVVDDNKDIVLTLRLLLEDVGYEVSGAHDGREALVEFAGFDPDAVIADIGLPGASGWEIGRAVRKMSEGDRPLMIAISGEYTKVSDRILTEITGFNYFLAKPFDPKVLLSLLAQVSVEPSSI
jgi:DNA-binding response OmpR family regulator